MKRIAVIPGDGVGPEVVRESVNVLAYIAEQDPSISFAFDYFPWGTDHYLRTGEMMPQDGLDALRHHDAILFGAVGSPRVKDHITLRNLLFRIRLGFDQYVNLRPIRLLPGVPTPLGGATSRDIDMIFVREGTEGEYAGAGDFLFPGTSRETALQTAVFSRLGTERVIRWTFELARRKGRSVTSVSKGNALQYSDDATRRLLVDAAAMFMVREPRRFEIVVASNLYADILTDLGAGIMGGMGLAASASLNPERRFPSTFEPIHGSAPDIKGAGRVNPIGSIWSAALMLDHLGYPQWGRRVVQAIERTVASPRTRTADLGGTASTGAVGEAVVTALAELAAEPEGAAAS